jgi:hypothetical protein
MAALKSRDVDAEIIVSDNSTSGSFREQNAFGIASLPASSLVRIVYPPKVLSPPENFEFALDSASGDFITYITDKMMLLPDTLGAALQAIQTTGAELVNWGFQDFAFRDSADIQGGDITIRKVRSEKEEIVSYDPLKALHYKLKICPNRALQSQTQYIRGKIVFGCYDRGLITRVRLKSGSLFGGSTHDYSAMIQALALAKNCVDLRRPGVLFATLPQDQSLGSLTSYSAEAAAEYYKSFENPSEILSKLLVPFLTASQHNMVAHDYLKFLPLYGLDDWFDPQVWLSLIGQDLHMPNRVWVNLQEEQHQLNIFESYLRNEGLWKQRESTYRNKILQGTVSSLTSARSRFRDKISEIFRPQRESFSTLEETLATWNE